MLYSRIRSLSFLLLAVLLFSSRLLFSQDHPFALSAYANFTNSNEQNQNWHLLGTEVEKSNGAHGYFSPALLLFRENGDYHEFEISRIGFNTKEANVYSLDSLNRISQLVGGTSLQEINVALRYNYSFLINLFDEESKFKIYVGAGGSPYFIRNSAQPKTSELFPASSSIGGFRFSAIPGINYSLTNHWFLNLNIPITVANAYFSSTKSENPALPISNRKSSDSDIKFLPNELHIRFGLGLKI